MNSPQLVVETWLRAATGKVSKMSGRITGGSHPSKGSPVFGKEGMDLEGLGDDSQDNSKSLSSMSYMLRIQMPK